MAKKYYKVRKSYSLSEDVVKEIQDTKPPLVPESAYVEELLREVLNLK